jgi:hypothetical protein
MSKKAVRREIFECPHCGADVAVGSKVCRECGSDASTGWQDSEEVDYQSLDLPEGYADRDDHPGSAAPRRSRAWIVVTALVLAALLFAMASGLLFRW